MKSFLLLPSLLLATSGALAEPAPHATRAEAAARKAAWLAAPRPPGPEVPSTIDFSPAADSAARLTGGIEDFETDFPGTFWQVDPAAAIAWGKVDCASAAGTFSAWCGAGGTAPLTACSSYPDNLVSEMWVECAYEGLSGDFSDSLSFTVRMLTSNSFDELQIHCEGFVNVPVASQAPDTERTFTHRVSSNEWLIGSVGLGSAFDGMNYVRITFRFVSDGAESGAEGAYLDNIILNGTANYQLYPIEGGFVVEGEDGYENNDTVEQAYLVPSLPVGSTVLATMTDEDWYRLSLPTGHAMRATVDSFDPAMDNIQVQLFDDRVGNSDGFPLRLSDSYGTGDTESLTFVDRTAISTADPDSGFLFLRVYSEDPPSGQMYRIRLEDLGRDDAFEPNNGPCQFTAISTNTTYENLICGDDDVFLVNTTGLTEIDVQVDHVATWGQLYFQVIENDGSCGFPVIGNDYNPNNNTLFSTTNVSGRSSVLVRVYGSNLANANIYSLRVTGR